MSLVIAYLLWDMLVDDDLDYARAAMADLAWDQDLRHQAALRRSEKLRAIGSQATFCSGLARINGDFRSVQVGVTPRDFGRGSRVDRAEVARRARAVPARRRVGTERRSADF